MEQVYRDLKEVDGGGEQQVRRLDTNIGCMTLTLIKHTLVELWGWNQSEQALQRRRQECPWDDDARRPSHADRCHLLRRLMLDQELSQACSLRSISRKIKSLCKYLAQLAA